MDASKVVLFRIGPRRVCQMLLWDLDTDEITPGQWIKADVWLAYCDVSPDCRYVSYYAADYSWSRWKHNQLPVPDLPYSPQEAWWAISRPPYFSALALWFVGRYSEWDGGVWWKDNKTLASAGLAESPASLDPSPEIILETVSDQDHDYSMAWMTAKGWSDLGPDSASKIPEVAVWLESLRSNAVLEFERWQAGIDSLEPEEEWLEEEITSMFPRETAPAEECYRCHFYLQKRLSSGFLRYIDAGPFARWSVVDPEGVERRVWLTKDAEFWFEVDRSGRLVFAEKGCLWAWPGFPEGEAVMVADLRENKFEKLPPPDWAKEW